MTLPPEYILIDTDPAAAVCVQKNNRYTYKHIDTFINFRFNNISVIALYSYTIVKSEIIIDLMVVRIIGYP